MATPEKMTAWCQRLRRSDHSAFESVFRTFHDPLVNYTFLLTKNRDVALDIAQDAFIKLWERRESLDPNRSIKALLYTIVRNLAYNHRRDQMTREAKLAGSPDEVRPEYSNPHDDLAAGMLQEKMQRWIDALPTRQREALILSRNQGLSHEEIASVMELSPRTVNNHIVRALKYLHGQISRYEPSLLES